MELSTWHCRNSFDAFGVVLRDVLKANYLQLHRRLHRSLGCADLASECLHEIWLRLGEARLPVSVRHPKAYIYRATCNLAMTRLRAQRPIQSLDDEQWEQLCDESPDPATTVEARAGVAALERMLGCLPSRHRTVLLELRLEEKTREEVARCHGLSVRRVDTVLRQALDCCAQVCGETVQVGVSSTRRSMPRRWRAKASAVFAVSALRRATSTASLPKGDRRRAVG